MSERKSTTHLFASAGARTERGGWVMTDSKIVMVGLPVAAVGDIVQYEDGGQAVIIDGAGGAMVFGNQPCALVGSRLSNGDRIVSTFSTLGISVSEGE
ncbi:PAAR domain-containing protein [Ralstonia sp. R-29]|uniref:PAAR domain-containing protein n=1 Tax=Ralstonia sp. R-29 TaxID=3404059 RepID=UPI003CE88D03